MEGFNPSCFNLCYDKKTFLEDVKIQLGLKDAHGCEQAEKESIQDVIAGV